MNKTAEWDDWLELATFSYNTSVHKGAKWKPYELVFGKLACLPSSVPPLEHEKLETYDHYLTQSGTRLQEMRDTARHNLISAKKNPKSITIKKLILKKGNIKVNIKTNQK